ncbi:MULTISPECIES: restriction endonuclease subunit S [Bacillus]|jgi:type I restriction enzyme S subunit|uniref:HsdS n=1 Tax=Bacillus licheniformis (strain ATCC 14580 / DSM 13 / JCM 2505 / CCUG 7422 / NBRC 12200 / NCIMB 9375 / NCTC 10341 / NRRL NRS-1264 / Gibson 46) TaxID=279010 RepID=Q65CT6_BACLD|nr:MULTISPECIES: restriction endonuclease subunit S [Bacillus]AAU25747.1 HsdS [Bacillus licheniformis DSM 13 = ATCC 14580]AAU43128.1 RM system component [Bacillus licheniformis DSM 13 = ATCC 14580]MBG9694479.1 hypothetical protein [Bacillus licheniformis]MCA1180451.1 restriction endonuclease subunit S [Bacillus licheniformis]MCM3210982.1 restriction endonuclease subunit S [Bacillus licheniformis]
MEAFKQYKWENGNLSDIADITMGQSPPGNSYNDIKDGIGLINGPTEFTNKYPVVKQWTSKPTKLCKAGDILLCVRGSSTGRMNIADDEYCIGRGVASIRAKKDKAETSFIYYTLNYKVNQLLQKTAGSTFPNLSSNEIKDMIVGIPLFAEQQKIASILSTWDKAIELKEKLIEQKKEQKKGLMQKLLTGKVRLPGFSDKWEKKKIGELLEESKVIAKNPQLDKRITVRLNLKGVCKREISTVEKEGATTQYIRKEGQFIYGKQNLHKGAFGLIPKELDGFQSSSDIPCFDFKEGVDGLWFYYYFSRESFYTNLENISSGTGSKRIQPKELYKLTIKLPSLREQQRQSKILECSDKEIYLLEKELETYRKQKQGLMQLLLTGKVRVKV